ncbi:hypothetical protein HNY73_007257 [Argiope bruennichi]|uniref:Uncharacterized protein n=1 Tax=Argiope bruennichi TaxID=94029 RepID=A0A8T0FKE3_ARGBR|nr:hypothetical protein HNY73_007257 [Argiope bruennichi]
MAAILQLKPHKFVCRETQHLMGIQGVDQKVMDRIIFRERSTLLKAADEVSQRRLIFQQPTSSCGNGVKDESS